MSPSDWPSVTESITERVDGGVDVTEEVAEGPEHVGYRVREERFPAHNHWIS